MLKKVSVVLWVLFCAMSAHAQDFSANWKGYFSYNSITAISYGEGKVYAAAQNSVFSYDLLSNELETISTINGLSGEQISAIHYSDSTGILFVGYQSGLMDVVKEDGEILSVVDIVNKTSIPPNTKQINHFSESHGTLYIASAFGISLYDMNRLEFDDSYFIGDNGSQLNINQTAILGDYIYASSLDGGIRRALVAADNLIDFNNWSTVNSGSWLGIEVSSQNLYGINANNTLQQFNGSSFTSVASYQSAPLKIVASENSFTVTLQNQIFIYNSSGSLITTINEIPDYPDSYNTTFTEDGNVYIGTQQNGLLVSSLSNPTSVLQVLPDGPLRNDPFSIEAVPDELWVVYGDYSAAFNPFPLKTRGLSHLREDQGWINIPYEETLAANNLVNITINPDNLEQVFISSYNSGLLEINGDVPTKIFDENNSGLSDITINPTDVRINGAAFDSDGNLWMTNSQVENGLAKKSGDQIQGYSVEPVISDFDAVDAYTDLVVDRQGNVFFGSNNRGLIGYNPLSDTFARLEGESDGANLPSDDIRSLAIDNSGTLWIGTTSGLRLLFGPSQIFDNPEVTTSPIVILENDIPVELLNDQIIQTIEVDGSNNKWIGTVSSGVFYFSSDGQETLLQFNEDNSPLPSNNIQDVTIDSESGEVYFATPLGLVSYRGSAVSPEDDLESVRAFPNPVRPNFAGMVTIDGLTSRANIKITDVTGNLVYEEVSEGGSIQWDTTAFGRHKVASGVYLILVTSNDASETKVAKLMIIR